MNFQNEFNLCYSKVIRMRTKAMEFVCFTAK